MRHQKAFRKFGRTPAHRRALFRNLATSLFKHEKLETTVHKAKDLRSVAEKLITLAGKDNLANRRRAYSYLLDKGVVHKLFTEIGPRYEKRPGGYTRVIRTRRRPGDAAELAVIELVEEKLAKKRKTSKKTTRKAEAQKSETKAVAAEEAVAQEDKEQEASAAEVEEQVDAESTEDKTEPEKE